MKRFLLAGLLIFAALSCYRREPLEIYYEDSVRIRLEVDWLNHMEEKPSGMMVLLAKDGDAFTFRHITNHVDSVYLNLEAGTYKLLIMNYAFDEFSAIQFQNQDSYSGVVARSVNLTSRMNQSWDRGVVYMANPDILGVALDTLVVTREDIESNRHFIDWRDRQKPDTVSLVRRETVYPVTGRLNLYVRVQGYKFLRSVEGAISGMADGCVLSSFRCLTEDGPQLLDSWTHRVGTRQEVMAPDSPSKADDPLPQSDTLTHDWLVASIPTFGLPGLPQQQMSTRDPKSNILTLCFTLIDGTTHVYSFDAGSWLRAQEVSLNSFSGSRPTGVSGREDKDIRFNLVIDLPQGLVDLPYAEDPGSGSGSASSFDVIVDDWQEGDDVDVNL